MIGPYSREVRGLDLLDQLLRLVDQELKDEFEWDYVTLHSR